MALGNQTPQSVASEYATLQFIIQQMLLGLATATLVKVVACTNDGGLSPAGTVDVQLLVDMVTQDGQTIPQGVVYKAPYLRMQGGVNAIILDPEPGDMGVCVFASRDISALKNAAQAALSRSPVPGAPPGSARIYSLSDALYLGGMLNATPTRHVRFTNAGIEVVAPDAVTIQAPTINLKGNVVQTDGDVSMSQTLTVSVDVEAGGISLVDHTHGGVQSGSSDTDPPNP